MPKSSLNTLGPKLLESVSHNASNSLNLISQGRRHQIINTPIKKNDTGDLTDYLKQGRKQQQHGMFINEGESNCNEVYYDPRFKQPGPNDVFYYSVD